MPLEGIGTEGADPTDGQVPALQLIGLVKRFGVTTTVDHIDLVVPRGSFFGLVGPNGAGKTTSLSMAVGLLRPDGGSSRIWHEAITQSFVATSMLKRTETLDDVGNVAAFAASDLARSITATDINITYGRVAD